MGPLIGALTQHASPLLLAQFGTMRPGLTSECRAGNCAIQPAICAALELPAAANGRLNVMLARRAALRRKAGGLQHSACAAANLPASRTSSTLHCCGRCGVGQSRLSGNLAQPKHPLVTSGYGH